MLRIRRLTAQVLLLLLVCAFAAGAESETVYLSATGSKYHREACRTLKYKPTPIERTMAEKGGYVACKICHP